MKIGGAIAKRISRLIWAKTISAILGSIDPIPGRLGAVFPWLRDWLDRPVIASGQRRNWWHMGRTGDGNRSMQIVTYWYVTNRTDQPFNILNAYITKPRSEGMVITKDTRSEIEYFDASRASLCSSPISDMG